MRGFLLLLALLAAVHGLYLPGVAPKEYAKGEQVELKVNSLTSAKSALDFQPYAVPICRPKKIVKAAENLGEHLTGDSIRNSPFELQMHVNETCKVLCTRRYDQAHVKTMLQFISDDFNHNWILDSLPAAATGITYDGSVLYSRGIPLGGREVDTQRVFVYNHFRLNVKYHNPESGLTTGSRIVGFNVHPMSVVQNLGPDGGLTNCPKATGYMSATNADDQYTRMSIAGKDVSKTLDVTFSYDVFWTPSDVRWASRWDIYLSMGDRYSDEIHWFAIVNSVIIAVFLTGLVAMILVRALFRDLSRYNRVATDEEKAEDREETGWKLVHADVFRPPQKFPQLFAVFSGAGTQVLGCAMFTILFSAAGFLSPANRGSLMIGLLVTFLLLGAGAGYVAARTHKMFDGRTYQRNTLLVAFGFPGMCFATVFILNLFVWHTGSTNAIDFGSMMIVVLLWFLVSIPLVFVGAYFGFKKDRVKFPVAVGSGPPRDIPEQPVYLSRPVAMAVGGLLPFGCVFVELFFILSSLWLDQYYYVFGFLLLVFLLLAITCAEISIVLVYFQLCAENYRWWWNSVLVPGASGFYLFLYSMFYFQSRLDMADSTSVLLYFGYMGLISTAFGIITGTMGYLATLTFNMKIYGAIKVE